MRMILQSKSDAFNACQIIHEAKPKIKGPLSEKIRISETTAYCIELENQYIVSSTTRLKPSVKTN